VQQKMSIGDAVNHFSLLSVGDGLSPRSRR